MIASSGDIVFLDSRATYRTTLLSNIVQSHHPILVLLSLPNNKIRICSISSNITADVVNGKYPQDVILQDWEKAGLKKKSYVATDTSGIIDTAAIYKTLGRISNGDLLKVQQAFWRSRERQLLESTKVYNTGYPEYIDYTVDNLGRKHVIIEAFDIL